MVSDTNSSSLFACALLLAFASSEAESKWLPLPEGEIQRIAFGSCAKQWQPQPIWQAVIAADPDVFLFLGDAIYGDTDGKTAWAVTEGQLAGEWNRLECICKGPEIVIKLNGKIVNRCLDSKPTKGRIQIQSEGAEVFFRRFELISLDK